MINSRDLYKVYDRFLEIIDYMDRKYINMLEELVIEEAEILSKKNRSETDLVKLWGINYMKNIIAGELCIRSITVREEEEDNEYMKSLEEAVVST